IFALGAFLFTTNAIEYVLIEMKIGQFLLHEFISIMFFIFFLAVNVGNIVVSYSTLFKSPEVQFLFTKPVDPKIIFTIKFFDNFFYSSSTLILMFFSVFAGYVIYFKLSIFTFLVILLFNILPFLLTAGALGVIILMIIMKLATKIRIRTIFFVIVNTYLILMISFFEITSPLKLVNDVLKYYPDVNKYFTDLISPIITYLPNHWLSDALYWMVNDNFEKAILPMLFQIILALLLTSIALLLGKKWYYNVWLISLKFKFSNDKGKGVFSKFGSFDNVSRFSGQTESLMKKELFTFMRDPSQIVHLSILLFLILLFITSIPSVALIAGNNFYLQTVIYISVLLFNGLLVTSLSLRFVFPLISLEGESFWKIKTSPISIKKYMKLKLFPYLISILSISLVLSLFSNYKFSTYLIILSTLITIFIAIGLVFLNFGMGGYFAIYKEKNPIRIASSQGATITFLVAILYITLLVLALFVPLLKYFERVAKLGEHNIGYLLETTILIGIVSIILSI
ncbi:MAG: hypothetical protein KAI45_08185, partial [Melioribacteraceae bacterium]|nr:hypothetical protein [Melioribacteraceae bacterium]